MHVKGGPVIQYRLLHSMHNRIMSDIRWVSDCRKGFCSLCSRLWGLEGSWPPDTCEATGAETVK